MNQNNNNELWRENNATFNVPSSNVENPTNSAEKTAGVGVVGADHKERLGRLMKQKQQPAQQETKAPTNNLQQEQFVAPEASKPVQQEVSKSNYEGISLNSGQDQPEVVPNNEKIETAQSNTSSQPAAKKQEPKQSDEIVDSTKEFEGLEKPTAIRFGGFTNRVIQFFNVPINPSMVGKTKNGGVEKMRNVEEALDLVREETAKS